MNSAQESTLPTAVRLDIQKFDATVKSFESFCFCAPLEPNVKRRYELAREVIVRLGRISTYLYHGSKEEQSFLKKRNIAKTIYPDGRLNLVISFSEQPVRIIRIPNKKAKGTEGRFSYDIRYLPK